MWNNVIIYSNTEQREVHLWIKLRNMTKQWQCCPLVFTTKQYVNHETAQLWKHAYTLYNLVFKVCMLYIHHLLLNMLFILVGFNFAVSLCSGKSHKSFLESQSRSDTDTSVRWHYRISQHLKQFPQSGLYSLFIPTIQTLINNSNWVYKNAVQAGVCSQAELFLFQ